MLGAQVIEKRYLKGSRRCDSADVADDQPITLRDVMGLWMMLAGAIIVAMLVGAAARSLGFVVSPQQPAAGGVDTATPTVVPQEPSAPGKRKAGGGPAQCEVALYLPAPPNARADAVQRLGVPTA